jgi:hypothetical protein
VNTNFLFFVLNFLFFITVLSNTAVSPGLSRSWTWEAGFPVRAAAAASPFDGDLQSLPVAVHWGLAVLAFQQTVKFSNQFHYKMDGFELVHNHLQIHHFPILQTAPTIKSL